MIITQNRNTEHDSSFRKGEIKEGTVVSINDKDVVVDIGFKSDGVIPLSEFAYSSMPELNSKILVFINELDNGEGRLSLSKRKADFIKNIELIKQANVDGTVLPGTIRRRVKGGMIVNVLGIEAFLPGSQISLKPIPNLDQFIGKELHFKVMNIDEEHRNIILSRRMVLEDERSGIDLIQSSSGQILTSYSTYDISSINHQNNLIYYDREYKRDQLERTLTGYKKKFGKTLFPTLAEENILDYYFELVSPEHLSQTFYISNVNLNREKSIPYIFLRPKIDGPRLESAFPHGLCVAFKGTLYQERTGDYSMTVYDFVVVSQADRKDFELEADVELVQKKVPQFRKNNMLSPEFVEILQRKPISLTTMDNLNRWLSYLDWREEMVRVSAKGIRYIDQTVDEKGVSFKVVCQDKDAFIKLIPSLRFDDIYAYEPEYSSDEWDFVINLDKSEGSNQRYRPRPFTLGSYVEHSEIKLDDLDLHVVDLPKKWAVPVAFRVSFDFNEDDQDIINNISNNPHADLKSFYADVKSRIHSNGFLAPSAIGDVALIDRLKRNLNLFTMQGGYSPNLSTYLFDISKAQLPKRALTIDHWKDTNLNDEQKRAVQVMCSAPDIALIQGPPGTGKTTVIAEAIYQLIKRGEKVLLSSQSNTAVDNALEKLAQIPGIRAVRFGKEERLDKDLDYIASNVLNFFYRILSKPSQERLTAWKSEDKRLKSLEDWLSDAYRILPEYRNESEQNNHLKSRLHKAKETKDKLDKLKIEFEQVEETKSAISKWIDYTSGSLDFTDIDHFPDEIIDDFQNQVIAPVRSILAQSGIDPFLGWTGRSYSSPDELLLVANVGMDRIHNLEDFKILLNSEYNRISSIPDRESITDSTASAKIAYLENKLDELENQMDDLDENESKYSELDRERRSVRKEIKQLRESGSGSDMSRFKYFFNISNDKGQRSIDVLDSMYKSKSSIMTVLTGSPRKAGLALLKKAVESIDEILVEYPKLIRKHQTECRQIVERISVDFNHEALIASRGDCVKLEKLLEESVSRLRDIENSMHTEIISYQDSFNTSITLTRPIPEELESLVDQASGIANELRFKLSDQSEFRKLTSPIMDKWLKVLSKPNEEDVGTIQPLYLKNCQVVGMTCTENPKILTDNEYHYFDTVIIDEVSKATPPELIMPLMLGRRAVLVGDHRQLPPLFREKELAWEEVFQMQNEDLSEAQDAANGGSNQETVLTQENYDKYKTMVTASLFKQYFELADPQIKSSLFTQYRMHPHIMDTINHFYENRLVCGIDNPDQARNHGLLVNNSQCEYLAPNKHVVWIDSSQDPCGRKYYETKMQQKGCYNELEARILISVLIDINKRLKELNQTKSVGIISFYAMQIRQLNILLKQHISKHGKLSNVRWRISTVDKFQGREQDIILVSLVRNRQTVRKSAKAFVAQFERVNVAMSRARELLIVTGAKDMLADYPVLIPNMDREGYTQSYTYKNIMEQVNLRGSFYPSSFIISPEEWKSMANNKDGRNRYDNRKS